MMEIKTSEVLPASHVSEVSVLFLMIHYPECRDIALAHLQEADFFFGETKQFFRLIAQSVADKAPVTQMLIAERILAMNQPTIAIMLVADWNDVCIWPCESPGNFDWHAGVLIDATARRGVHALAERLQDEAVEKLPDLSSHELIESAETRLRALRRDSGTATETDIRDLFASFEDDYQKSLSGIVTAERSHPTGIASIDAANRGPHGAELVVIAARPSVGKTALGMQISLAGESEKPSYVFSLEMTAGQLRDRAIAHLTEIPLSDIKEMTLSPLQLTQYTQGLSRFRAKCRINFKTSMTVEEICHHARTANRVLGIRLVMVDYLGLIHSPDRFKPLHEKVGHITGELKSLAKELAAPILLLCQLNRESEKAGREPMLSDLRSSGDIEQDADQVWMIHAPNGIEKQERTLIIAKGRNTGAGTRVNLNFLTDIQQFRES